MLRIEKNVLRNQKRKIVDMCNKRGVGLKSVQGSLGVLLNELLDTIPMIRTAAIVSIEGLPIVSALPQDVEESQIAVITSTILSLAERVMNEMHSGDLEHLLVHCSDQYFIVFTTGQYAVLTISAPTNVNLGLIFLECGRFCEKISKLI